MAGKEKEKKKDVNSYLNMEARDKIWDVEDEGLDRKINIERVTSRVDSNSEWSSKPVIGQGKVKQRSQHIGKKSSSLQNTEDSSGCYHSLPMEVLNGNGLSVICAPKLNPEVGKIASSYKRTGRKYLR